MCGLLARAVSRTPRSDRSNPASMRKAFGSSTGRFAMRLRATCHAVRTIGSFSTSRASRIAAEDARGFLRRFHKDQHTIDFAITRAMTVEQLRKYLAGAEDFVREMALALFVYYCAAEVEEEQEATAVRGAECRARPHGRRSAHRTC